MAETPKKPKKPKVPRQPMPEQPAAERVGNFDEVPYGYTPELAQTEAGRCIQCKKPKCVDGCPVEVKIPEFVQLIAAGDFAGAARKIKETNALPAVCGRVCPQETQCEERCVLGKKHDPVAIGRLERFAADFERENELVELPEKAASTGKKVAVVGAGPAGLTVAGDLVLLGHEVTLFEALHAPGGVLAYGIPEFRLPKRIVRAEVDYLAQLGVEVQFNQLIGTIYTIEELLTEAGFDAVFIGSGAGLPSFMSIAGENLNGVYSANEYLTRINLMKAYQFPKTDTPVILGQHVVTLGGGNVAMDSARSALRVGAESSTILYRRTRTEMPARDEEIHHAEEEGVRFEFLSAPLEYVDDGEGWVEGLKCIRMELGEPDASGRRRPMPIEGSEFVHKCDLVIVAIGNRANPLVPRTTPDMDVNRWGNIVAADDTGRTTKDGVWAGGDIVTGAATVISAMGAGKRAARNMHAYLMNGAK